MKRQQPYPLTDAEVAQRYDSATIRRVLRILNKEAAWQVLAALSYGAQYLAEISENQGIPYTTVQNMVSELEHVGFVRTSRYQTALDNRPIKLVRAEQFTFTITYEDVVRLTERESQPLRKMRGENAVTASHTLKRKHITSQLWEGATS